MAGDEAAGLDFLGDAGAAAGAGGFEDAGAGDGLDLVFFEVSEFFTEVAPSVDTFFGLGDGDDGSFSLFSFMIEVFDDIEGGVRDADIFHIGLFIDGKKCGIRTTQVFGNAKTESQKMSP